MKKSPNKLDFLLHDINNILFLISGMILSGKITEAQLKMKQIFGRFQHINKKFNPIDYLINAKMRIMKKCKIKFSIKCTKFPSIDNAELCIIFGNLLDNAIESCVNVSGEKFVKFNFIETKNQYIYKISNSASACQVLNSKKSKHLGIKIVKNIIKNNKGKINFLCKNNIFTVKIKFLKA